MKTSLFKSLYFQVLTAIAIGILLFIFIALQRGLTVLWENRQSSPVTRVGH